MSSPTLLVFSHLRWGFVYQRPQHLLSRLARHWPVVFVEEPVHDDGPPWLEVREHEEGRVTVIVPHTPVAAPAFHDEQLPVLEALLSEWLARHSINAALVWLYTPMALPLVKLVQPLTLIYDCMDELTAFRGAPRQLRQRESALMKLADIVFTGGPSLYRAKQSLHPFVLCMPSAVDAAHFAPSPKGLDSALSERARALQPDTSRPRLGFFGVIDERLDVPLIDSLARERPDWEIIMVGPVVKIDPAELPKHANIRWLGQQPYELLPALMAGWSVCLMPFALNESTRFISPTKTLEYMAGEKPVVSTPIHDVVQVHGEVVMIAATPQDFIAACDEALAETPAQRATRIARMQATVKQQSWDRSAELMRGHIEALLPEAAVAEGTEEMPLVASGAM